MKTTKLTINNQVIKAEIAKNILQQSIGLMFRKKLNKSEGMLFVFTNEWKTPFWMLFTFIPVDIIWIDKNKKIIDIAKNTTPFTKNTWIKAITKTYNSKKPFKYALEINAGISKELSFKIGEKVEFGL